MGDDLESLDNASLRAKCKEYGLPNVPVTDSSRRVLIRKLRACMETANSKQDEQKRRNSEVPVAKYSPSRTQKKQPSDAPKTRRTDFPLVNPTVTSAPIESAKAQSKKLSRRTETFDNYFKEASLHSDVPDFHEHEVRGDIFGSEATIRSMDQNQKIDEYVKLPRESVSTYGITSKLSQPNFNSGPHIRRATMFQQNVAHKDDEINTPYLSDFARTLERLKNEPLRLPSQTTPRLSSRPWNHYETDRKLSDNRGGVYFKKYLARFGRNYHLKLSLIIVFTLLLAVFIYVFFFM